MQRVGEAIEHLSRVLPRERVAQLVSELGKITSTASDNNRVQPLMSVPSGAFRWKRDRNGGLLNAGDFEEWAGAEMLGWKWTQAIHPEDVLSTAMRWGQLLAQPQPAVIAFRMRSESGSYELMRSHAWPCFNESGELSGWVGYSMQVQDEDLISAAQ